MCKETCTFVADCRVQWFFTCAVFQIIRFHLLKFAPGCVQRHSLKFKTLPLWMNDRGHTNSVPWIYGIDPENHLVKLSESNFTESADFVHSWYGFDVAPSPFIHGIMVRNWCALVYAAWLIPYSEHCTVYCTLYSSIHLSDFLKKFIHPSHFTESCNSLNSPYGVIKISINLLLPVQVTL